MGFGLNLRKVHVSESAKTRSTHKLRWTKIYFLSSSSDEVNKNSIVPLKTLYKKLTYPITNGQPPTKEDTGRSNAGECVRLSVGDEVEIDT